MSDWPEGWSGDNRGDRYGRGSAGAQPESARVMRQVRRGRPAPPGQQGAYGNQAPPYGGVPQQAPAARWAAAPAVRAPRRTGVAGSR